MQTVGLQEIFTLGIRHDVEHMIIGVVPFLDTQMRLRDGLTCGGMHHDIAQGVGLGNS